MRDGVTTRRLAGDPQFPERLLRARLEMFWIVYDDDDR
jgi:hypothetical protein